MRPLAVLLALALWLWMAPVSAETGLQPFHARYDLTFAGITFAHAEAFLELAPDGGYRYGTRITPIGLAATIRGGIVTEVSHGRILNGRIRPDGYDYDDPSEERPRQAHLSFDWDKARVLNDVEGSRWALDVPAGTQDKMSGQLAMILAVLGGARSEHHPVADGGLLKEYGYEVGGQGVVHLRDRDIKTLRVERTKGDRPADAIIWLAPELGHLPVKIERTNRGRLVHMELVGAEVGGVELIAPP